MRTFVLLATLIIAAPVVATTYTLEPNYTQVVFSWDHLGYSHPAAQVSQGTGMLEFDPMEPTKASLQVTLPLSSLLTGVPELDQRLKSEDFFDVARHPRATFQSTRVEKGMKEGLLTVSGNLTIRAVTRPVTLQVEVLKVGANPRTNVATVGFNAMGRLKRSEFGLDAFVPQVSDDISLQITCQGAESKAYAAHLQAREAQEKAEKQ